MPTEQMLSKLSRLGFDDYVSLKWEKSSRFGHHLPSSETALTHFAQYMRQFNEFAVRTRAGQAMNHPMAVRVNSLPGFTPSLGRYRGSLNVSIDHYGCGSGQRPCTRFNGWV